jgi:hypothetical protein
MARAVMGRGGSNDPLLSAAVRARLSVTGRMPDPAIRGTRPFCGTSQRRPGFFLVMLDHVHDRVDECQVGERLREIAKVPA